MNEPETILPNGTRIRTSNPLDSTAGFMVKEKHLQARKPGAVGIITGIVGGHGGDVYWVAHFDTDVTAAYGWMEFELEPAKNPCPKCDGMGLSNELSKAQSRWVACPTCNGTAELTKPRPTAWEHLGTE
jgi:hypothetical protein